MCTYDDMRAEPTKFVMHAHMKCKQNKPKIMHNVLKILETLRYWCLVTLLLHPVYAIPLRQSTNFKQKTPSHRSEVKKGVGSSRLKIEVKMEDAGSSRRRRASDTCGPHPKVDFDVTDNWMEPCRNHNFRNDGVVTKEELSNHIMKAIMEANSQIESFIDHFSHNAFGVRWEEASAEHKDFNFDFLNTGSGVSLDDASLSFEDALLEAYELIQRRAVGIEEVTLDQSLDQPSCLSNFKQLERLIVGILCQLRHAMISIGVTPRENVTKDIMPEQTRKLDSEQARNIRDSVILREYITALHKLHSVFMNYSSQL